MNAEGVPLKLCDDRDEAEDFAIEVRKILVREAATRIFDVHTAYNRLPSARGRRRWQYGVYLRELPGVPAPVAAQIRLRLALRLSACSRGAVVLACI